MPSRLAATRDSRRRCVSSGVRREFQSTRVRTRRTRGDDAMIVLSMLRAVPVAVALIALGWMLDRVCHSRLAGAGLALWPARGLIGLAAMFAVAIDPLGIALIAAVALLVRRAL